MRFIVMHKVDAAHEAGGPPSQKIMEEMGQLVQGSIKGGVFENGAGLHRSVQRVKVELKGGQQTVTHGPLTGGNQLVASFAMIKAKSIDEAIDQAGRFGQILGDSEIEIGPVVEPWDLGMIPKPPGELPGRFLLLMKSTKDDEQGKPLPPAKKQKLDAFKKQLTDHGLLLLSAELAPSKGASRLPVAPKGAKRTWVDGPFAESKELIGGFSILNLPSKDNALKWADRYAAILEINEVDVREVTSYEVAP